MEMGRMSYRGRKVGVHERIDGEGNECRNENQLRRGELGSRSGRYSRPMGGIYEGQ
jgi:hypothetical protein